MWYLGGKMRQAPRIVAVIRDLHPNFKIYVEPFCGALWSATAVMRAFPGRSYILNDVNPHLVTFWKHAQSGFNPPECVTENDYKYYNKTRPLNDPMTGYIGFAWSFSGKFFGGAARTDGKIKGSYKSTVDKIKILRESTVMFTCGPFEFVKPPHRSMVYLDPPYNGRTAQSKNGTLDRPGYFKYAEGLAKNNKVIATEFINERNWPVLFNYGDTVVRHLNARPRDGTVELLLQVTKE